MRAQIITDNYRQLQVTTDNDRQEPVTTDNNQQQPLFYTVPDAARLIGTAPVTLYRRIRLGEFPAMHVGRRVVVPARAIEAMVDAAVAEQEAIAASQFTVVRR